MRRTLSFAALLALPLAHGHCQSLPTFEVASITPCKPGTPEPEYEHTGMAPFIAPGGRFDAKSASLKFLIEWAYGILPVQHSGGPDWMGSDRFDIVAKAPSPNVPYEDIRLMTQALLAERFKLKLRRETREVPVVAISIGKTPPKLSPPKDDEKRSLKVIPQMGTDQKVVSFHVVGTRFSLAQLNQTFARQIGRVIVDETGLKGDFNFAIDLTPDESSPSPLDPTHILNAMRDQLGFVVKSQKGPVDFLVIESAEKVVAGN
jgi:uncharacterized protein (TIGR03435 family)